MKKIIAVKSTGCVGCCFKSICKGPCSNGSFRGEMILGVDHYHCQKDNIIYKEVDSNEMPELKAGMIVEFGFGLKGLCVPVDNGSILVIQPNGENICIDGRDIQKIYYIRKGFNFVSFIKNDQISPAYKLIWSKNKSKIEEIEQTILKLQQEVKELKNDN